MEHSLPTKPQRTTRQALPLYLACYTIWLVLAALGVWLIFELRSTLFGLAVVLRANPWVARAIDRFSIFLLGILWLVGILWLEDWLRRGVERDRLWQRAVRVAVFMALLLGICYGIRILI